MKEAAQALAERLRFISHKSNMMQWRIQFITQRTQAQMTAVSLLSHIHVPKLLLI
jgi:hypothetical protein